MKNNKSLTLVTAYYDLGKYEQRPAEKTKENYLKWGEFLFKLDINIVFFISREISHYILNKRKKYNLLNKTLIICREFEQLPWSNQHPDIKTFLHKNPIKNGNIKKDSSNYIALTWNKVYLVEEITKLNPFKSQYFGWIDFGIYGISCKNISPINEKFLIPTAYNKIKILEINHTFPQEIKNIREYTSSFGYKIGGGLWIGSAPILYKFINLFKKQLYKLLSDEIVVHEETIMSIIYCQNYNMFDPYFGEYSDILLNYNKINRLSTRLFANLSHCIKQKSFAHINKICSKIYKDCYNKLTPLQKFHLFDKWTLTSFYVNKNMSQDYVSVWLDKLKNDPKQLKFVIANKKRILKNLSYYDKREIFTKKMNEIFDKVK